MSKRKSHPQLMNAVNQAIAEFDRHLFSVSAIRKANPKDGWPFQRWLQLLELHRWVLANMPKVILELGSGWTTLVLSRYACEFGAKLVTVEENPDWLKHVAEEILPPECKVNWCNSPTVNDGGCRRYEKLPDDLPEIDLLYVDGPNCDYMGKSLAGNDAVKLLDRVQPKHVLFDMRHESVDLFREATYGQYVFSAGMSYPLDEQSNPWYLRSSMHHSWFWRK